MDTKNEEGRRKRKIGAMKSDKLKQKGKKEEKESHRKRGGRQRTTYRGKQ